MIPMSAFFAIFESMGEAMDIFQSKSSVRSQEHTQKRQEHIKKIQEIVQRSGFDLDNQALHRDYLKVKHDFDMSATKVLYDKRAS